MISMSADVILIGCVSKKEERAKPAKDLYNSPLFVRRRAYAERASRPWFVLSALHGLVAPETVLEPYNRTLREMLEAERIAWGKGVVEQLEAKLGSLQGMVFELHAGEDYARSLEAFLRSRGASVARPVRGLTIGRQLQWYDRVLAGRQLDSSRSHGDV